MSITRVLLGVWIVCAIARMPAAEAASAPDWVRAQVNATVPAHDDETDAVVMFSETQVTVLAPGKMKRLERRVYKILRANGEGYGVVSVDFSPQSRVTSLRGWSIPALGKDFETKERDIVETAITDVDGGELISDVRRKVMRIPAAVPGNIIGYEFEQEMLPYEMTDEWGFQDTVPVREARYLPANAARLVAQSLLAQSFTGHAHGRRAGAVELEGLGREAREARAADAAVARHRQ